jgi:hypothetical protein
MKIKNNKTFHYNNQSDDQGREPSPEMALPKGTVQQNISKTNQSLSRNLTGSSGNQYVLGVKWTFRIHGKFFIRLLMEEYVQNQKRHSSRKG